MSYDRQTRLLFIWILSIGILFSGLAFAYKIAGFIYTLSSPDFRGTFDVSIVVYFFVSAGWGCLLLWSFLAGKFKDMETQKKEMIAQEAEYERLGI
jgi:hypothetical protein